MEISLQFYEQSGCHLAHIQNACQKYWKTEKKKFVHKIKDICKEEGITEEELRSLINECCHAYTKDVPCSVCNSNCLHLKSRHDYLQKVSYYNKSLLRNWVCEDCKIALKEKQNDKIREAEKEKYNLLTSILHNSKTDYVNICNISFENAIFLLSAIRLLASENLEIIYPCVEAKNRLSPTTNMDMDIFHQLCSHNLLLIYPEYSLEHVTLENDESFRYKPLKIHWVLPLSGEGESNAQFVARLEDAVKSYVWPDPWFAECDQLCKKVCLHECFQYLHVCLESHGFPVNIGDKTELILGQILDKFSVGQVYNFIWKASRDAASLYMRGGMSKKHAANCVPGSIQRTAERALAEGWDIKPFRRDFRAPQSMVSNILFNTALQAGERAFSECLF